MNTHYPIIFVLESMHIYIRTKGGRIWWTIDIQTHISHPQTLSECIVSFVLLICELCSLKYSKRNCVENTHSQWILVLCLNIKKEFTINLFFRCSELRFEWFVLIRTRKHFDTDKKKQMLDNQHAFGFWTMNISGLTTHIHIHKRNVSIILNISHLYRN